MVCVTIATPASARIVERVTVGSTSACRTILRSSLLVVFLVAPDPIFHAWIPSLVHCSQQFLTAHSEQSTWSATRRVYQPAVFIPMIRRLSNSLNCAKCLLARLPGMFRLPKSSYNRRYQYVGFRVRRHHGERTLVAFIRHRHNGPSPSVIIEVVSDTCLSHFLFALTALWTVHVTFLVCYDSRLYPFFEPCETLRFSRIMHERMLPVLYGSSLIRKCSSLPLACACTRYLSNRKYLVLNCRVTDSAPYASHCS
ncbi:uncharacterized protein TNCV_1681301 [Trichonephila clavipes]|nr:uncharacterized protein TNCV_1681301 [Trichonephila clavipes]